MTGLSFFKDVPRDVRIPGGCDECDAYQTIDDTSAPIYVLRVHHDQTCSWLAQRKAAS